MNETISRRVHRVDVAEKSDGTARYIADFHFEGMLYARTLRADRPRARILSIDLPPLPPGYTAMDRRDIPGRNRAKILLCDWPIFAEGVVNHVGEPILLLVGPDREVLDRLVTGAVVHYEDLDPILDIDEALSGAKTPLHGEDNCFAAYTFAKGDSDRAFAASARVIEGEFHTGLQEHAYLEPQGVIGLIEDGRVVVYGSMQCPYYVKKSLIEVLGTEPDRIRVVQTTTGGAFGGKEEYPSLIAAHAAVAALKTGRPVQVLLERSEDIQASTKRHPSRIRYRTALDADGRILGMEVDIVLDGGAYAGLSAVVLQRAMFSATGVYHVPHLRVTGRVVATNTAPNGAFRGFGGPQAFFAVEMHMEQIARELGLEPLDFKLAHALKAGDQTATGGRVHQEVKLLEMVARVENLSDYRRKRADYSSRQRKVRRGIGVSLFLHGCGFTGEGEKSIIKAQAKLVKDTDDRVEILIANVEMGQGAQTTLKKVVAEVLDIPLEQVVYRNPDTDRVPDSGPTVASRTAMVVGKLLERAARRLKAEWRSGAQTEIVETYQHPVHARWDQATLQGDAYAAYAWGANVVEVEVDPLTLEIDVKGVWGVYDVGVPLDEQIIQGQIEGGLAQGLGYATLEVMQHRAGRILQDTLTDYIIPTAQDVPHMQSELVLNPYEYGPFGAKGAGELPLVGAAPALAAAVQQALGIPVHKIPITPEELLEALERRDGC